MNEKQKNKSFPVDLKWEEPGDVGFDDLGMYDPLLRKISERRGTWGRMRVMTQSSAYSTKRRLEKKLQPIDGHWQLKVSRVHVPDQDMSDYRGLYARLRTDEQMQGGD